jgi:hypothetical protein
MTSPLTFARALIWIVDYEPEVGLGKNWLLLSNLLWFSCTTSVSLPSG